MNIRDDTRRGFIDLVVHLARVAGPQGLTLREVRDHLDERAYGLMILILSVPCLVPALYGVPQIVGVPIVLLAGQLLMGRDEPWLPDAILNRRIPRAWLERMARFADRRMRWSERLSRPRLRGLASGVGERFAAGFMILATATIVLPMTNTIPSVALVLLAVGIIQRDGLFVALGTMVAVVWAGALAAAATGVALGAGWAVELLPRFG